jgi:hypothetical protein
MINLYFKNTFFETQWETLVVNLEIRKKGSTIRATFKLVAREWARLIP